MAENIQALIEKINQEGVQAAEEKAKEIEFKARQKAEEIIEKARLEAQRMQLDAQEKISKMREREKTLITQAGRDLLLELREKINAMLILLIEKEAHASLSAENMFKILTNIIQNTCKQEKSEITIVLNKDDLYALEADFLVKLKEEVKKEIILKPSEVIHGGFIISFDAGKSQFDFSDNGLAEYIGTFLKPRLREILQPFTKYVQGC